MKGHTFEDNALTRPVYTIMEILHLKLIVKRFQNLCLVQHIICKVNSKNKGLH